MSLTHDIRNDFSACPAAADRAWNQNSEPSYDPDIASEIDSEEEIIADTIGITISQSRQVIAYRDEALKKNQAMVLGGVITLLLEAKNVPAVTHALALAAGLDQLNGAHSQTEVAKKLGCTRALISHYTQAARDVLTTGVFKLDCFKFRKSNASREVFRAKATDPFTAAKQAAIQKVKNATNRHEPVHA